MAMKKKLMLAMTAGLAVISQAGEALAGKDLDVVKARGQLICGVAVGGIAGFMTVDSQGKWTGMNVDICRGISAALFGDSEKVKYVPLSGQQRFTALQAGEVDLLSNNSTWTLTRDTALGLDFTGITDYFRTNKMTFKPVLFEDPDQSRAAFFNGRCDAYSGDQARLYATRVANAPNPDDYVVLPEIISKEPLGPVVRHGDNQFADIVRWVQYAMIEAEEYGITSNNVDEMLKSD